jgi:ankyrin repeat protein
LLCAAAEGKANHVERLLQLGANPAICRQDGNSPLTIAAALGFDRIVQTLLAAGDDVNRADSWGWTALHNVAEIGDTATAGALLACRDLDLNARELTNKTPLMLAAAKGHDGIVKLLVEAGANRRLIDRAGVDALALAIKARSLPVIRELLRNELALDNTYRGDPDSPQSQPQHVAAGSSSLRKTAASALPNYPNPDHLGLAVAEGNAKVVQTLLTAGADPARRDNLGDTALHHAARLGQDEIAKLLLRAGALLDVRDREGRTPMDVAIEIGNASIAECLISEGAQEPKIWNRPRESDLADFLSFVEIQEDAVPWLVGQLRQQPGFVLRSEQIRLRAAKLPFYDEVYLVAAEDPKRRGPREQFALCRFGEDIIMLDWTNGAIYAANGRWGIDLTDDETARTYGLFFFHFVRGEQRYNFVEHVEDIRWQEAATQGDRQIAGEKLLQLKVVDRSVDGLIKLKGSVLFTTVLFHTAVVVATAPAKFIDDKGDSEMLSSGEIRLTEVEVQLENLSVDVDGTPGVFG